MAKRASDASAAAKLAAEAHTNLNVWAAVTAILGGGLLYGRNEDHASVDRVIKIAHAEQQKWLRRYDTAIAKATADGKRGEA